MTSGISPRGRRIVMQTQNKGVPISSFQYWIWKLKHLSLGTLLLINVILIAIIVLFPQRPMELVKEWYPGGVKPKATIQVLQPTFPPTSTIEVLPTLPPAP